MIKRYSINYYDNGRGHAIEFNAKDDTDAIEQFHRFFGHTVQLLGIFEIENN